MEEKQLIISYVYKYDPYPFRRILPSNKARITGKYRFVNTVMEIEVEEKSFFGLCKRLSFIPEDDFYFTYIENFKCSSIGN